MTTQETSDSNETLSKELVVQNKMGIHARPAAMIVRIANTYSGEVWVDKDDEQVNGKSIMGLMMLAADPIMWVYGLILSQSKRRVSSPVTTPPEEVNPDSPSKTRRPLVVNSASEM